MSPLRPAPAEDPVARLLEAMGAANVDALEVAMGLFLIGLLGIFVAVGPFRRTGSRRLVSLGLVGVALTVFLAWVLAARGAPLLGALLLAVPVLAGLAGLGARAGPWLSGLSLYLSGRLRRGDFVALKTIAGTMRGGDPFRAVLIEKDGTRAFVPWSAFARGVESRPAGGPHPVRLRVEHERPASLDAQRRLEIRVALCPYRVWSRPAVVRPDPERPRLLEVELWSWSEEGARLAEDHIRRAAFHADHAAEPESG